LWLICLSVTQGLCQIEHLNRSDSGKVLSSLSNYDKFIAAGDKKEASRMMDDVATVYWNHNDTRAAIKYFEKSLQLNAQIENENGMAMIHNNLGMLYNDVEDYQSALSHFKITLKTRRAKNEPTGIVSALVNLSVVCNNLKQYAESVAYLQEALSLSRQINDPQQMSSVYAMLSETYEKKGDVDESMKYFQLFKSFHDILQKKEISKLSGDIIQDSLQKQLKELELQKKAIEIKEKEYQLDSTTSLNKSLYSNLNRQQIAYRLLESEENLRKENAIVLQQRHAAEIAQKNHVRDILVVVSIFLIALGVALVFYNRLIASKNKRLLEQNLAIEKQKEELEESNLVKTKIFSIIAHDLRSPLNAVQSFFNVIHLYEVGDDVKNLFTKMGRDLSSLSGVLDTLLNWAMAHLHELKPQVKPVNIWLAVNENVELLTPVAEQKSVVLINNVPSDLMAATDLDMTKIVVRNLVQNALKFTRKGGTVTINGKTEQGSVLLTVCDTGVGMSNEKIDSLFSFKSNQSTKGTSNEKGTGLGLVLCAELVKLCEGEILIDSEINKGTTATLKFNTPK
jgi:two-component system, sensor histidine kinase and response regulator